MPSWELQLISAIAKEREYKSVVDAGISPECFGNLEARTLFDFIGSYFNDTKHYGEVASRELILENFPRVDLPRPKQSLEALCEKVKQDKLRRDLRKLVATVADTLEEDPEEALAQLCSAPAQVGEMYVDNDDVDFGQIARDTVRQDYEMIQASGGATGLPWPWPELTEEAGGIEQGDLVVIYGLPKSLKTWIALSVGVHLYENCGCNVLIYSAEMNVKRLARRVAMLLAKLDYEKFQTGTLSTSERDYLFDLLEFLHAEAQSSPNNRKIIFTKGMSKTDMKVEMLRHKIETYKPDIVILDSAYHLSDDMDWRTITKLTQGLKRVADDTNVPIIAVTQENERAAAAFKGTRGTASIANSPSWQQDADILIRCVLSNNRISIHTPALRERRGKGIRIWARPAHDFTFIDRKLEQPGQVSEPDHSNDREKSGSKFSAITSQARGGYSPKRMTPNVEDMLKD